MTKEIIDRCREYLCINGLISIPFIQKKFKLSYKDAKKIYYSLNREKHGT